MRNLGEKKTLHTFIYDNEDAGVWVILCTTDANFSWDEWFEDNPEAKFAIHRAAIAPKKQ